MEGSSSATSLCGRDTYRTVNYCQEYAEKCIELGIPAPFASQMASTAAQLLKNFGVDEKNKSCRCRRCNLNLSSLKTVSFRLSMPKKKIVKSRRKRMKRSVQLLAICKGCGAEMRAGALAVMEHEGRDLKASQAETSRQSMRKSPQNHALSTTTLNTPVLSVIKEAKISSSGRRRKRASKLQQILALHTPVRKASSLQSFLEASIVNT